MNTLWGIWGSVGNISLKYCVLRTLILCGHKSLSIFFVLRTQIYLSVCHPRLAVFVSGGNKNIAPPSQN